MPDPYARHLVDDVLGWWMENGPDREYGGVLTCWDNAGTTLVSTDKYTWSQGRWVWLMARVVTAVRNGMLDLDPAPYLEQARTTAAFLRDHAVLADGSTAYVTDRAGSPKEPVVGDGVSVSVFADLFAALGFAGLAQLDPEWGEPAEEILLSAARRIEAGTYRSEPYPVPSGHDSFALPMILLGVGEQVHRATKSAASAEIVRAAVAAIEGTFVRGTEVVEMPPRTADRGDLLLSRHRAPGHTLEALWFLQHAADLVPGSLADDPDRLAGIAVHACRLDWDDEYGGLLRFVDREGGEPTGRRTDDPYEALVVGTWDTKLWWPHAEALYTTALLSRLTGRADVAEWHEELSRYTLRTFPAGPGREWVQIRQRDGSPLEATVALPVKDPFHIARSLLLLVELLHTNRDTEVQ
ncbi:N-acylglucosamine 2-epimerase [Kribbella amoyensis]|uniref:N-acylglucosamine 2-epimerase n=1 Tax=Kribbella amoyensis TaxID=996641 RepID=A0A561BMV7_9ACTN|nr:AGE family epimerase/isomerase [Kribbella amoyensis]TWD80225.1 N-acylglucosamine 2-epimerase [Kribbella amoyensis]